VCYSKGEHTALETQDIPPSEGKGFYRILRNGKIQVKLREMVGSKPNEALFFFFFSLIFLNFIFKLYNIVLVLPNIEMHPPQVYLCSPS